MFQLNESVLPPGKLIAAVSGGADSMAMLHALHARRQPLLCLHVEHGIRGEEALRDAAFVEDFCKASGIPCRTVHLDIPSLAARSGRSLETVAREERYRVLLEAAAEEDAFVAVAHTQNDQAETVLMHLLRGSGLEGLTGMKPVSGRIIRPLLGVSRRDVESYCRENGISFVTDSTNADLAYTRNRTRQALGVLEELSPHAAEKLAACAALLEPDNAFLMQQARDAAKALLTSSAEGVVLSLNVFSLPQALSTRVIMLAWESMTGSRSELERVHLDAIAALQGSQCGRFLTLPGGITVHRSYRALLFCKEVAPEAFCVPFSPGDSVLLPDGRMFCSAYAPCRVPGDGSEYLDADALGTVPLCIRSRRSGDLASPPGMAGTVKLKELLINKKIPVAQRATLPLLACREQVFCIPGILLDRSLLVTTATKRILRIWLQKK